MTNLNALRDLEKRLAEAKGPDREIDALMAVALLKPEQHADDLIYYRRVEPSDDCAAGTYWRKSRSGLSLQTSETYTASLDGIVPLCKALLPDSIAKIVFDAAGPWWSQPDFQSGQFPRFMCLALVRNLILRALIAQGEQ